MMEADEAGTLARLKTLRREVFDPLTTRYGGRIFKNTGDGALTEFPSAVDAVECLMAIQQILGERNASPYDSWEYMYANGKSFVLNCEGRLEEGLRWARRAVQLNPNFLGCQRHLIAALYLLGEAEEATRLARAHQELLPNFTMSRWLAATPFRRTPDQERTFDAMRAAGLPD